MLKDSANGVIAEAQTEIMVVHQAVLENFEGDAAITYRVITKISSIPEMWTESLGICIVNSICSK